MSAYTKSVYNPETERFEVVEVTEDDLDYALEISKRETANLSNLSIKGSRLHDENVVDYVQILPEISVNLLSHQPIIVQSTVHNLITNSIHVDTSDTGVGKTYNACASIAQLSQFGVNYSAFILCPKPVVATWFQVANLFGLNILGIANYEMLRNNKYYLSYEDFMEGNTQECDGDYITVTRERNHAGKNVVSAVEWNLPIHTVLVIDESHVGKNHKTLTNNRPTINHRIVVASKAIKSQDCKIIMLSATPSDKPENMLYLTYLLGMHNITENKVFDRWLARTNFDNPEKLMRELYPKYICRMSIQDIKEKYGGFQFENKINVKMCSTPTEIAEEIDELYKCIQEFIDAKGIQCILAIMTYCRMFIEYLRMPAYIKRIQKKIVAGKHCVVFTNFNATVRLLQDAFSGNLRKKKLKRVKKPSRRVLERAIEAEDPRSWFLRMRKYVMYLVAKNIPEHTIQLDSITEIVGGQTAQVRENMVQQFRNNRSILCIANIQAGGVGLSLQDADGRYPRYVVVSPNWSGILTKQAFGRCYRVNSASDCEQEIIFCTDKTTKNDKFRIEERVCELVGRKLGFIHRITDGSTPEDEYIAKLIC